MNDHRGNGAVTDNRAPTGGAVRAFSIINGLVVLGVLLQAVWAGGFIGETGGADWRSMHQITAYIVVLLSLVVAILAGAALRRHRGLLVGSVVMFVLLVIQTALGDASGGESPRILVAAHIPLAMLIMALGVYLSIAGARARRSA